MSSRTSEETATIFPIRWDPTAFGPAATAGGQKEASEGCVWAPRDSFPRGGGAREARRRPRPTTPNIARTEALRVPRCLRSRRRRCRRRRVPRARCPRPCRTSRTTTSTAVRRSAIPPRPRSSRSSTPTFARCSGWTPRSSGGTSRTTPPWRARWTRTSSTVAGPTIRRRRAPPNAPPPPRTRTSTTASRAGSS